MLCSCDCCYNIASPMDVKVINRRVTTNSIILYSEYKDNDQYHQPRSVQLLRIVSANDNNKSANTEVPVIEISNSTYNVTSKSPVPSLSYLRNIS